jgi:hypothetical protein
MTGPFAGAIFVALLIALLPAAMLVRGWQLVRGSEPRRREFHRAVRAVLVYYGLLIGNYTLLFLLSSIEGREIPVLQFSGCILVVASPAIAVWTHREAWRAVDKPIGAVCERCGYPRSTGASVCPECGAQLPSP